MLSSSPQDNQKDVFPTPLSDSLSVPIQEHTDWIEGSHFDASGQQSGTPGFVRNIFSIRSISVFIIVSGVFFLCLVLRVGYLQIILGEQYRNAAENNRQRLIPIPAERGLIFDKHHVQLTKNIPNFSLALVPQDLPRNEVERNAVIEKLATLVEKPVEDIRTTIETYGSYSYESIVIQENLEYETALKIHIAAADIPGIHIFRGSKRLYIEETEDGEEPLPKSMSHILGYLGKLSPEELDTLYDVGYLPSDTVGKSGVEKTYEPSLRGIYGTRRVEVDSFGKEQKVLMEEPPISGSHVILSIDIAMQRALERLMSEALETGSFSRGAAVVMDPYTGAIQALVSIPSYDNNDFSGGIDATSYNAYISDVNQPLFNRAISGMYPSGSTLKPAIAAAALEEGIITPDTSFLSTGGLRVGPWFFPDWQAGGHGRTNVRYSLAWSVNTFYYYIGGGFGDIIGLGVDTIIRYLRSFGFSQAVGIDIPGEATGFLPSRAWKEEVKGERWYVGDTYNLSIGQGDVLVTPLQMTAFIASLVNGGTLYAPHVVEKTIDIQTKEETPLESQVVTQLPLSASSIETVLLGMKDCVEYGSCRRLSLLPFSSAGKTGTAQWSNTKEPHAWFVSFAPFEQPEIVLTILVEEGIGGSETAAPIAYDFYRWWWGYITTGDTSLDEV